MSSNVPSLVAPTPLPPASLPQVISRVSMALSTPSRALFFDVFGTCVDWRTSVTQALNAQSHAALNSPTASLASRVRLKASDMTLDHWGDFAQQWRDAYHIFTRKLAADPSVPFKTVDEHHFDSLKQLVHEWGLDGLWTLEELRAISSVWHRLEPWPDTVPGIGLLSSTFWTCTLSNGNYSLLTDLAAHAKIPFTHIFSAEMFGTYKPAPEVYRGASEKLDLPMKECVMVAAHLDDLKAAKSHGMQVIYVERLGEEKWSAEEVEKARSDGWVDIWVGLRLDHGGFLEVAQKLGIQVPRGPDRTLSSSV